MYNLWAVLALLLARLKVCVYSHSSSKVQIVCTDETKCIMWIYNVYYVNKHQINPHLQKKMR